MLSQIITTIAAISVLTAQTVGPLSMPAKENIQMLSEKEYSLSDRYSNTYVNDVFSDNILLTLAYLRGVAKNGQPVDWGQVREDFSYNMIINPGDTFAFHDSVLPQYANKPIQTTNAHFDSSEGFKSDGWLVGDGVCHLASFMNVAAKNAGLDVVAPTRHDFAAIPDVARVDGVAIYYMPGEVSTSSMQNLYITNNFDKPVIFVFTYKDSKLDIKVEKVEPNA